MEKLFAEKKVLFSVSFILYKKDKVFKSIKNFFFFNVWVLWIMVQ